jgi:hypothetical protein
MLGIGNPIKPYNPGISAGTQKTSRQVKTPDGSGERRNVQRGSPIAVVHETHVPPFADDDVVEDADAHDFADGAQALVDLDVLLARGWIAAYAKLGISGVMRSSRLCGVGFGAELN